MADAFPISASVLRDGCGNVALDCCTSLNHCGWTLSLKCSQMLLSTQHARIAKRALPTEHSILFAMKRNRAFSLPNAFSTILLAPDKWQLKFLSASLMTVRCPNGFMRFGVSGNAWSHNIIGGTAVVPTAATGALKRGLLTIFDSRETPNTCASWQRPGHRHCSIWIDTCGRPMLVG